MNRDPRHDDVRELLGAYALNALDADERADVDDLLLNDASARAELHELEHAAAWLGHASLRPSAGAWDAIAAEVAADVATAAAPRAAGPGPTRWLVAAVIALILAAGTAGIVAVVGRSSTPDTVAEQAAAAARRSGARTVQLVSDDGRWSARAVVTARGTGYLGPGAMPAVPSRRVLQLWSITPSGPVSGGIVPDAGWFRFRVADGATALAVTEERAGGSATPTGTPIVTGELAAS